MPTGYTSAIQEGISFKDFLFRCAHAFDIECREIDLTDPLPVKEKPEQFYFENIKSSEKELDKFLTDPKAAYDAYKTTTIKSNKKYTKNTADTRVKYDAMLIRVKAWNPPTPTHQGLKDFMISQIEESIKWDCGGAGSIGSRPVEPVIEPFEEWVENQKNKLQYSIDYSKKSLKEAEDRIKQRNEWIKALVESV